MTNLEQEAIADLKDKVGKFMDDAKKLALANIDKLQDAGADIAGDHLKVTETNGPWLVPRDFVAAFADDMKYQFGGYTKSPADRTRNKRIKNYWRLM